MNGENKNQKYQAPQVDCDQLRDLLPAYSMNMTDPQETQLVEQMLPHCPEVAEEWEDYQLMAEALLFSAPAVHAPAHIADKLREATSTIEAIAVSSVTKPQSESPTLWQRLQKLMFISENTRDEQRTRYLTPGFAVIALILVVLVGYLFYEVNTLRDRQKELTTNVATQDNFLAFMSTTEVFRFDLSGTNDFAGTDTNGILLCNPEHTLARLQVEHLEPLPNDRTYQVWLTHGTRRVSVGTFDVDHYGRASLIFDAPLPMREYQYIGISQEPIGGSENPTGDSIVRGRLY